MKPRTHPSPLIAAAGIIALLTAMPVCAQIQSPSRVIRLSFVEGTVTVQRPDVQGWAEAPVNTPLQQGFKLSTGENSFAEIQFENGGAIRLGEQSLMEFLEGAWKEPDEGIWEVRGPRRHFTHSKMMAWVAFDRAVRLAEHLKYEAPLDRKR